MNQKSLSLARSAVLLPFLVLAALLSGCATSRNAGTGGDFNVLGLVRVEKQAYTPPSKTSLLVRTDELAEQKDFSGNKTELFWGLITITDY